MEVEEMRESLKRKRTARRRVLEEHRRKRREKIQQEEEEEEEEDGRRRRRRKLTSSSSSNSSNSSSAKACSTTAMLVECEEGATERLNVLLQKQATKQLEERKVNALSTQKKEKPGTASSMGVREGGIGGWSTKKKTERIKPLKNDYSQHFVDTRQRPQNFIRDTELADRFEEYPKLRELITLKDQLVAHRATPPMYLKCDLKTFDLSSLGAKFDLILIDPPWEEYSRRSPGVECPFWSFEEIAALSIESIAESPCFLFLWCGSEEGLDQGRLLLKKWGFRRCEDICWIKTNKIQRDVNTDVGSEKKLIFHHTKEHCLMGIKGTVRRNQDGHIIHANVDTDVIVSEEPALGSTEKPEELYHIIEHFALGRRRIELFGTDHNIRSGWVTVGNQISGTNYSADKYRAYFSVSQDWDDHLLGSLAEIEELRPKSPTKK